MQERQWLWFMILGFILVGILIMLGTLRHHIAGDVEASISAHHISMVAEIESLLTSLEFEIIE